MLSPGEARSVPSMSRILGLWNLAAEYFAARRALIVALLGGWRGRLGELCVVPRRWPAFRRMPVNAWIAQDRLSEPGSAEHFEDGSRAGCPYMDLRTPGLDNMGILPDAVWPVGG